MYINGEWVEALSGKRFDVTNPATGEVIGDVPDGSADDARAAIGAADAAFGAWASTTAYERADLLYKAWQLMKERTGDLAALMTKEQGKPLRASTNEIGYGADFLRFFAEEATRVAGEWLPSNKANQRFLVLHQPVGVVAAITPWNYPISMLTRKMGPALAAGCPIVLKAAEATPMCAQAVIQIFHDAGFPPGVVNLVTALDPKPIGEVFTTDPRVRKLTFTGSTAVGKMLAGQAASNMKRVSVELGGHAPFLVFPDADPVRAAKGAAALKYLNSGQACISPNRLFVHRSGADAFIETLIERVGRVKAGPGTEEGVTVGPLVNEAAVAKVENQVIDALDRGAKAPVGGTRLLESPFDKGHFFAPTLLTDVTTDMLIYREETFGPVAPVIVYDDVDDVIEMANDTEYGLAAYVYSDNLSTAIKAFEQLRFGIVGINDVNPTAAQAPFGGMKDSGLGREGSREGIKEYLETKLGGFAI